MGDAVWDQRAPHRSPPPTPSGGLRIIRVTEGGPFVNRIYSYWPNAWVNGGLVDVFAGHVDGSSRFFSVEMATGAVQQLGSLIPYGGTTEGWYWDAEGWVCLLDGPRLRRVNPFTQEDRVIFDISDSHPGCRLWQAHSSDDGQTHSATVERVTESGPYERLGTVVVRRGALQFYGAAAPLDESQVTPDGEFLVIKEGDDNRIITLATGEERTILDRDGALGHSDCGPGFMVGEDNQAGECARVDLRTLERRTLFKTWAMGHVSVRGGRCLLSDALNLSLVHLDGSGITTLAPHGMVGEGYDYQVHANLDHTGGVACWLSNQLGQMDLFLMELK